MKKLLLAMAAGAVGVVFAGTTATWTGAENGFWTNANNWAEKVVPGRVLALDAGGNVITNGVTGDVAIFNGSETGVKATTIDFDGTVSIHGITVTGGATTPKYTFGTSAAQIIPIEFGGNLIADAATRAAYSNLTVDDAKTPTPILLAGLSTGIGYEAPSDWNARYGIVVCNNSEETLVVNNYGYNTKEPSSDNTSTAIAFFGTGVCRIDGQFVKGSQRYFGFYVDCRKLIVNADTVAQLIGTYVAPSSALYTRELEIAEGCRLAMNGSMHNNGWRLYHGLTVDGAGELVLASNQDFGLYTGYKVTFDVRISGDKNDPEGVYGVRVLTESARSMSLFGENNATGSVQIANEGGGYYVKKIGRKTENGGLGIGNRIVIGNQCFIAYQGEADDVSDRTVWINPRTRGSGMTGARIVQDGTGTLRWEGDVVQGAEEAVLILDGSSLKEGTWAGVIAENPTNDAWETTARLNVEKRGTGTWNLTAANTYKGTTTLKGGILKVSGDGSIASSSELVLAGGNLELVAGETASETVLPAVSVADGVNAWIVLGRNRSATVSGISRAGSTGTLDVRSENPQIVLRVEGQTAGTAPDWLTVNGRPATFDADGCLRGPETAWKAAEGGDWLTEDAWSNGLPGTDKWTFVVAEGAPYEVTISTENATAKNLTVAGADATVKITGSYKADDPAAVPTAFSDAQAYETPSFTVKDGATVAVDGGTLTLTNYAGLVSVRSDDPAHPSRLAVTNGVLNYAAAGTVSDKYTKPRGRFEIGPGGQLDIVDSTVTAGGPTPTDKQPLIIANGGTIDVRGHSVYHVSRESAMRTFGTGTTTFHDDAVFLPGLVNQGAEIIVAPAKAGETATVTFADNSSISNYLGRYWVGGLTRGGHSVLNLNSPATHRVANSTGTAQCFWMGVGINYGSGELNFSKGQFEVGSVGVVVGGDRVNNVADHSATGTVNLTGGYLLINGTAIVSHQWAEGHPAGLTVGQGTKTINHSGRPFRGTMNVSDGRIRMKYGHFFVGTGYAEGEVNLTGGSIELQTNDSNYYQDFSSSVENAAAGIKDIRRWATNSVSAVGLAGGCGRFTMSGGKFDSRTPMYVGGVQTNAQDFFLQPYAKDGKMINPDEYVNWPGDRHDADGKLTFAGGTFNMNKALTLGADGRGELVMVGKADGASFTVGRLVLSNNTASVVRFVPDAKGVTPVTVTGGMTIAPGAKLVVDITNTTKRHFTLFTYASCEGAFATDDVKVVGLEDPATPVIVTKDDGLMRISIRDRGLMLIVR